MYEHINGGQIMDVKEDYVLNHTFKSNLNSESIHEAKGLPLKDHRHSVIKKGLYIVGIQRRYDPFEKEWKKVIG